MLSLLENQKNTQVPSKTSDNTLSDLLLDLTHLTSMEKIVEWKVAWPAFTRPIITITARSNDSDVSLRRHVVQYHHLFIPLHPLRVFTNFILFYYYTAGCRVQGRTTEKEILLASLLAPRPRPFYCPVQGVGGGGGAVPARRTPLRILTTPS